MIYLIVEFTLGLNKTLRLQFISSNDFWLSEWNTEQFLQDLLIISLIGFVWGDYSGNLRLLNVY